MKEVRRFEYKYLISYVDYFKVINQVKLLLNHDKHGMDDSYPVNSVYLDDLYFSGAADKAFGNQLHKKYRVRYYNDESRKKLELKQKTGNESIKYSTEISEVIYNAIINQDLDVLEENFDDKLIRRFTLDMLRKHIEPKCNIVYKREAFRDENDNLRLTFDHSLEISRFDKDLTTENIKLMKDSHLILEIKYEHYFPKEIKQILNSISLNQIAYSKYFMGYNQVIL